MHIIMISKALIYKVILAIGLLLLLMLVIIQNGPIIESLKINDEKDDLAIELQKVLNQRSSVFISGDYRMLDDFYDSSHKLGKWAWEHEVKRIKYLRDWAKERGIEFVSVKSEVKVKKITKGEKDRTKVTFDEFCKFDYIYKDDANPTVNSFGVRLTHVGEVMKLDDSLKFFKDWYLDCFNDAVSSYNAIIPEAAISKEFDAKAVTKLNMKTTYDRQKAVAYADKYSAIPWANGGSTGYNKKYKNYNGSGGDCTNYISQCLGDKEAGGLSFDRTWYCHYEKHGNSMGSGAWLNAQKFKNYIIYSGKGKQIAKGTFRTLTAARTSDNIVPTTMLMLGDIISYEEKGSVVHNAIVTGFDSHGYPLVNTHTVDRYRVPWDLGWGDKDIQFFLIHIK